MRRLFLAMTRPLCALLRALQTDAERVSRVERLIRAALLIVPMGLLVIALRLHHLLRGDLEVEATTRDGVRLRCRLPDLVQLYLWVFGIWEPDLVTFLHRRLATGDGFIDIGAHVGSFALLAARRVGDAGDVLAVEASATTFADLQHNLSKNTFGGRVRAVPVAVSDARGRLTLYGGPAHNLGLTSTRQHRDMQPIGEIDAAPLSEIASPDELRSARLIKIDVEGGEDRVLRSVHALLDQLRDDVEILVELSPTWWEDPSLTPQQVIQPFIEAGFNAYALPNDYWPWRYLWPNDVSPPRLVRHELAERVERLDLVLSRVDAEVL